MILNELNNLSPFFDQIFFGNSVLQYAVGLTITVFLTLGFQFLQTYGITKLQDIFSGTQNQFDDLVIKLLRSIHSRYFLFISLFVGTQFLFVHQAINRFLLAVLVIWSVYQIVYIAQMLIDFFGEQILRDRGSGAESAISALKLIAKILLWAAGVLLILSNLGVDITSLVAGLGIGGIAIALAVQNILGDLLSSFAIYFDKPFEIGDFVTIDDTQGTVETIGIKTTRIRALQGEEIVVPNQTLTSSKIQNFKKMNKRRVSFSFGVAYETPQKKLRIISKLIQDIIEDQDEVEFNRAHLKGFGASSLDYDVVYFVTTGDYKLYMDIQENINLEILKQFEAQKIEMAYPTRTVYIKK